MAGGIGVLEVKLDRAGVGALLKSQAVADLVNDIATRTAATTRQQIAAAAGRSTAIQRQYPTVIVRPYTRDRRGAVVTVQHFAAVGLAHKYGVLRGAVPGATGITIRERMR